MVKKHVTHHYGKFRKLGPIGYFKHMFLENRTDGQTIFKNTFWLFLAEGFNKGLMFLLTILIARYLGAEGYGQFGFILNFTALFLIIVDFGMNTFIIREIAKDKGNLEKYIGSIFFLKGAFSVLTIALLIVSTFLLNKPDIVVVGIFLYMFFFIVNSLNDLFRSIFRGLEEMQYEFLSRVIRDASLLLIILVLFLVDAGIIEILFAYVLSAVISLIYLLCIIYKKRIVPRLEFSFTLIKYVFSKSSTFFVSALVLTLLYKIDITMLSILSTDLYTGYYVASFNLIILFSIIPSIILPSYFTKFARNNEKGISNKTLFLPLFLLLSLIAVIILLSLSFFSDSLLGFMYGSDFYGASASFFILLLTSGVIIVDRLFIDYLNATKNEFWNLIIFTVALVVNVLFNLWLIPIYQDLGAAIAFLISEIVLLICVAGVSLRKLKQ